MRGNPYVELMHWMHADPADCRTPTCTASSSTSSSTRRALAERHHRRARPAAARRHRRSPTSPPHIEEAVERGWVYGSLHVRRQRRCAPATCFVGMLKTQQPAQRAARDLAASSRRSRPTTLTDNFAQDRRAARPKTAMARSDGSPAGRRRSAGRGQRRDRAGRDGQAGGAQEVHRRPHRAGAQAARSTRSSAATRRSARSSTS